MDLDVKSSEIAEYLNGVISRLRSNPLMAVSELTHTGMILASIGFVKGMPGLKVLGDLLTEAPDKLRSLITLRYSLLGTLGEIQSSINNMTDEALREIIDVLEELRKMFDHNSFDPYELLRLIDRLYDLLVVKLPSIPSLTVEQA